jgi:UDP-2,3-diacylglucosamine pyrophosphatase LpxH
MSIVIISDVHLGHDRCNKKDFSTFLDLVNTRSIDHFVIAGDLLDFWRRSNAKVLEENKEILNKLFSLDVKNFHYVVGNHDYQIWDLGVRYDRILTDAGAYSVSKDLVLEEDNIEYYITHGYDLDVFATMEGMSIETYEAFAAAMCHADDTFGGVASLLWDTVTISASDIGKLPVMDRRPHDRMGIDENYRLAVSGTAHLILGMNPDQRLVFGHTHRPFINKAKTVANAGSWVTENDLTWFNTYVKIEGQSMELKRYSPDQKIL